MDGGCRDDKIVGTNHLALFGEGNEQFGMDACHGRGEIKNGKLCKDRFDKSSSSLSTYFGVGAMNTH